MFTFINIIHSILVYFVFIDLPSIFYYLGTTVYLSQVISHVLTCTINPGVPSRDHYITSYVKIKALEAKSYKESGYKICRDCNIIVHERKNVAHCPDCDLCVEGKI